MKKQSIQNNVGKLALLLALTFGGVWTASAAPSMRLASGNTAVVLSSDFVTAANTLNLTVSAIRPGIASRGTVIFPVTYGVLDLQDLGGEILHSGGLRFSQGNTTVTLSGFSIDTLQQNVVLTALVTQNGTTVARVPVFDLTLDLQASGIVLPLNPLKTKVIRLSSVQVRLSSAAAQFLNTAFSVTAFTPGLSIGTARVTSRVAAKSQLLF